MKKMEFKRNKEFDRPFWDNIETSVRYRTTSESANLEVREFHDRVKENRFDSSDTISLTATQTGGNKLSGDNISCIFSYPQFSSDISTSHLSFTHEHAFDIAKRNLDRRYCVKRNAYSEYNEQRIKFGLKF